MTTQERYNKMRGKKQSKLANIVQEPIDIYNENRIQIREQFNEFRTKEIDEKNNIEIAKQISKQIANEIKKIIK